MSLAALYTEIVDHIKANDAKFTTASLDTFQHYDRFRDQYQPDELGNVHPFNAPALFIERSVDYRDAGSNNQEALVELRLHVVHREFYDSADDSPTKANAMAEEGRLDLLAALLHGKTVEGIRFKRRRVEPNDRTRLFAVDILIFEAEFTDCTTDRDADLVMSKPPHPIEVDGEARHKMKDAQGSDEYSIQ